MRSTVVTSPRGSPKGFRDSVCRGGRRNTGKRVGAEDEILRKSRKTVDTHLRRIGQKFGKSLVLNSDGMCYFPFQRFIVVVEVPPDDPAAFVIYTMVYRLDTTSSSSLEVVKRAMQLNYMQHATRGSTLGLDGDEVTLCYTSNVGGIATRDFKLSLENFLLAASEANLELEKVRPVYSRSDRRSLKSI